MEILIIMLKIYGWVGFGSFLLVLWHHYFDGFKTIVEMAEKYGLSSNTVSFHSSLILSAILHGIFWPVLLMSIEVKKE